MRKKILLCIIFSLLIGGIYIYPDIRFIVEEGKDFKGITLTGTGDEAIYLARLNAVYKGDYRLGNIGLYEHRNDRWVLLAPYFEVVIGSIGKALNIPVVYLDIILSFLFPVTLFWLIYILIYYLSKSQRLGILGACSMMLGYTVFTRSYSIFMQIIHFKYSAPLWFLRPFSPQFNYIPFILSLILIFLFIDTYKKSRLFLIAFFVSLLNHLHLYLWAFIFVGLGVWLILAIIRRDRLIWKNITIVLMVSILLSTPYWINYYMLVSSPRFSYVKELFGMEYSRRPIIHLAYILISLIILFWNRKSEKKLFYFLLSFLLGGIVCLNQQIITGKILVPGHFSNYTNKTFMIIALAASLNKVRFPKNILERLSNRFKIYAFRISFVALIGFLFFSGFMQQNNYYHKDKKTYSDLQSIAGAFNWLNRNTEKEDVVLTDSIGFPSFVFVRTFLLYNKNYHYLGMNVFSPMPREEREYRILSAMQFFGYSLKEAETIFNYGGALIFFDLSAVEGVVKDVDGYIAKLKNKYINFMSKDPIGLLSRYKIDYVLVGKEDHLFDTIKNKYPGLTKVFDDGSYRIYKFNR